MGNQTDKEKSLGLQDTSMQGEWKGGKFDGDGIYNFKNGNKYVGEWKEGKRNGLGTFTFSDGRKYVG